VIYVLVQQQGSNVFTLLKSLDGGDSWQNMFAAEYAWGYASPSGDWIEYDMQGIEIDPQDEDIVYAYGGITVSPYYGGIWKSENGGASWEHIYGKAGDTLISDCFTDSLAIAPSDNDVLYRGNFGASRWATKIFSVSKDGGTSWTNAESGDELPYMCGVVDIAVHPTNESFAAVSVAWQNDFEKPATEEAGIYVTTDEGKSFTLSKRDFPGCRYYDGSTNSPTIRSVDFDPDSAMIRAVKAPAWWSNFGSVWVHTTGEVYVSHDLGFSWEVFSSLEAMWLEDEGFRADKAFSVADPNNFDRLYWCQSNTWRSDDGGKTWADLGRTALSGLSASKQDPGVVYAGAGAAPVLSRNSNYGSGSWEDLTDDIRQSSLVFSLYSFPILGGRLIAHGGGGPGRRFRSMDYGSSWLIVPPSSRASNLVFDHENAGVTYGTSGRVLRKGTDYLASSSDIYTLPTTYESWTTLAVSPTNSSTLFASVSGDRDHYNLSGIRKSADSGVNWSSAGFSTGSEESCSLLVLDPVSPEVMYKKGAPQALNSPENRGLWKSTDGGANWFDMDDVYTAGSGNLYQDYPQMTTVSAIAVDPTDNNIVYVGTGNYHCEGQVYITTNGGVSWKTLSNPQSLTYVFSLHPAKEHPKRLYAVFWPLGTVPVDDPRWLGQIGRRIEGSGLSSLESWTEISQSLRDQYGSLLGVWDFDTDGKTDTVMYAGTERGVYIGYDYPPIMPEPSIESVAPYYVVNLTSTNMIIDGNYFMDPLEVAVSGPDPMLSELSIVESNPTRIVAEVPPGIELGTYEVRVEAAGGTSNPGTFEVIGASPDGPTIEAVRFDGRMWLGPRDPVSKSPYVMARVLDMNGINEDGFEYVLQRIDTLFFRRTTLEATAYTSWEGSDTSGEVAFLVDPYIPAGRYTFTLMARDKITSESYPEGRVGAWSGGIEVDVGELRIIGDILSYPVPFKALGNDNLIISYNLNRDADVTVYVFDISGQVVLTRKFSEGQNGGHAGYNQFEWNGVTDFGNALGNGIYIVRVTSGHESVGSGRIVVLD